MPLLAFFISYQSPRRVFMNQNHTISAALASLLALGLLSGASAHAADSSKDKCYGIAKAGANDCSNLSGTHSCAGQATLDKDLGEWKYVAKGTCKELGGKSAEEAKASLKK
jgi:uncharacterized membrane protein